MWYRRGLVSETGALAGARSFLEVDWDAEGDLGSGTSGLLSVWESSGLHNTQHKSKNETKNERNEDVHVTLHRRDKRTIRLPMRNPLLHNIPPISMQRDIIIALGAFRAIRTEVLAVRVVVEELDPVCFFLATLVPASDFRDCVCCVVVWSLTSTYE